MLYLALLLAEHLRHAENLRGASIIVEIHSRDNATLVQLQPPHLNVRARVFLVEDRLGAEAVLRKERAQSLHVMAPGTVLLQDAPGILTVRFAGTTRESATMTPHLAAAYITLILNKPRPAKTALGLPQVLPVLQDAGQLGVIREDHVAHAELYVEMEYANVIIRGTKMGKRVALRPEPSRVHKFVHRDKAV